VAAKEISSQFPVLRKPYQLHELSRELQKSRSNRAFLYSITNQDAIRAADLQNCDQLSGVADHPAKAPARDRDQDPCNRPDDERGETVFRPQ